MRRSILPLFILLACAPTAAAQSSNLEVFQTLAIQCMDFLEAEQTALEIRTSARMPYVRSAIVTWLNENDHQVYLADSVYTDKPTHLNQLSYEITESAVTYKRLRKKKAKRSVQLMANASLVSSKGLVIADKACKESFDDEVALSDIPALSSSTYPETQGSPPRAGFGRRVLQPVMLTAATALSVYLFFTLRSEDSGDGN